MKQNVIFSLKDKETSPIMFCVLYDTQRTIDETKKQSMLESNERIQNKNAVRKKNYLITKASFIQNSYGKQSNAEILFKIG